MTSVRTVLLFGGRSSEHDVSILSARSVASAAPERIAITPLCMARDGRFIEPGRSARILGGAEKASTGDPDFSFERWVQEEQPDIVFPLIHGTGGEDGALQGFLDTLSVPYIGSGVAASAAGMHKSQMKQLFTMAKLPIVEYVAVLESDWLHERDRVSRSISNALRLPYFVKPSNGGSSVGVTKVKSDRDLAAAIDFALRFDETVLVERGVDAREIEVAVLGNHEPQTSVAGEVIPGGDFYDYTDKYIEQKSSLQIPARLPAGKEAEFRKLALSAFRAIGASGFARVDFFLERGTNRLFLNEINTIPGFTAISMYPKLWEATELKYPRLIEKLVDLGIERSRNRAARLASGMQWFDQVAPLT